MIYLLGKLKPQLGGSRMLEGGGGTDHTKSFQNLNFFPYSGLSHVEQGITEQPLSSLLSSQELPLEIP